MKKTGQMARGSKPTTKSTKPTPTTSKPKPTKPTPMSDDDSDVDDPFNVKPIPQEPTLPFQQPQQHKLPIGNPWSTLEAVLAPETLSVITNDFGFTHLTAVQSATIPAFLSNKDVCVQAVTGSGKTLAFVIPMIEILTTTRTPLEHTHIGAIIITPTRELAQQIASIVEKFTAAVPLVSNPNKFLTPPGLCIGGKNPEMELLQLKKQGVNILIGTPGRLDQVLNTKFLFDAQKLEVLILDEADRLLEAGFQLHLSSIMKRIPKQRRTGLFSATLTTQIQELAKVGLRNPVDITLKVRYKDEKQSQPESNMMSDEEERVPGQMGQDDIFHTHTPASTTNASRHQAIPTTLTNYYQIVQPEHKMLHLVQFLMYHAHENVVIFFLTCAEVDYFYRTLSSFPPLAALFNAYNNEMIDTVGLQHLASTQKGDSKALFGALHGQMNQSKRTRTLDAFKAHTTKYNAETFPSINASNGISVPNMKRLGSVLLCTDVAARGVDVNNIDWVVQVDPPQQPDVFIHRIGRAARAGQRGQALTFMLPTEKSFIYMMEAKHVPFNDYSKVQNAFYTGYCEGMVQQGKVGGNVKKVGSGGEDGKFDVATVESEWDKACWSTTQEHYFQGAAPTQMEDGDEVEDEDDDGDDEEDFGHTNKKSKHNNGQNNKKAANNGKTDVQAAIKADKLVSLNNATSATGVKLDLSPLPSIDHFKKVIPYNIYKVLVDKKEDRRHFKRETKKQSQIEHVALRKQLDVQSEQTERQKQLPPHTTVTLQYPTIPTFNPKTSLLKPEQVATQFVKFFIPHSRYVVSYDKYLFQLCQRAYVSHINGYKEHIAKFIFPFDRLLFVHVAIGFGMLHLPQLPDLKKYALIWPQLTRLQPKMITQFHNQQISVIKNAEAEKKKTEAVRQTEKRREHEKVKKEERAFKAAQKAKKNKTKAKTTYEEVRREWEELGDELKTIKKKKGLSKKQQGFF